MILQAPRHYRLSAGLKVLLLLLAVGVLSWTVISRAEEPGIERLAESVAEPDKAASAELEQIREEMIEAASMEYAATQAAYEAETVTLTQLCLASRHRLEAGLLSPDKAARIKAAEEHLERMSNHLLKIKALYQFGSKGGEAEKYQAMRFYVAEAKYILTKTKQGK